MDNYKQQYMEIDLEKVIAEKNVGLIMGSGDEDANMFIVSVKRGGETVNLAGLGVVGYLIMPNDETLRIPGSVVDNEACVTINKNGYVYDGAFQLAIKLVVNGKENTIAIFHGKNARTTSENISDGEKVIYGVKDILNMIDSMDQAEKDAKAAATSANNAAASANSAASKANTATSNANAATTAANNAAQTATTAAGNADNATSAANTAAQTANDAAGRAEAVASKSPYIGDDGNWYVFDVAAGAYVDSGFPSRGIPGQGAVSTVCGKQPDDKGNVSLTPDDTGALPEDGTAADADKLGGNLPEYYASQAQVDLQDEKMGVVCNGNQCALSAANGQYIILRNSTIAGLSDGLYKATKAIPASTAIDSTYLAAVSKGGFNAIATDVEELHIGRIVAYQLTESTDGRYYSRTFAKFGYRKPGIVVFNHQNGAALQAPVAFTVNLDGNGASPSSLVTIQNLTITVDCGANAWAAPYIICLEGAITI